MFTIVLILCVLVIYVYNYCNMRKREKEPPTLPGTLPIIGHAYLLTGDSTKLYDFVVDLSRKILQAGGVMSAKVGPRTIYMVTDPEDALTVANTCLQKDYLYDFAKCWLGEGLLTGKLSTWKHHRRLLNPAFNQVVLDKFLGVFNSQARSLVRDLRREVGKGLFDSWTYARHNTLGTIFQTAFGIDCVDEILMNFKYLKALDQILDILVQRMQKFWLHSNFIYSFCSLKRKQDKVAEVLKNMSNNILQKRKKINSEGTELEEGETNKGTKFKPYMDLLLELGAKNGVFTDLEIQNHVDTMVSSGHDTQATAFVFLLLMIGSHPEIQQKIKQELRKIFGNDDRDVTKEDLSQLVYLEAVLKETLRVYPIAPVISRILDRDVKLKNYTLLKGHPCFILVNGIHRHAMWGPDAEEFKPERWLSPATLPECPTAFAAFSLGKRNCIGKSYAYMNLKVILAHLMRHYEVFGDISKLKVKFDILLRPYKGYYISLEEKPLCED